jgi:hypothetical protein
MTFAEIWKKSLGELGGRCLEYPKMGGTIRGTLDWFKGEIQALPGTFTEANKNITCFVEAGILKMLEEDGCGYVPELRILAASSDASMLRDIPEDIARRLVRRWWTHHSLLYCMHHLKEDNQVSFIPMSSFWVKKFCLGFANY